MDRFVLIVEHLNRLMTTGRWAELAKMNLNVHQVNTLHILNHNGPMMMSAIATHLGGTQSHTTNVVDQLVRKKYIRRKPDPNDRRVVICEVTAQGRKATERYLDLVRERALKVTEGWDPQQCESVVTSLELLWRAEEELLAGKGSS